MHIFNSVCYSKLFNKMLFCFIKPILLYVLTQKLIQYFRNRESRVQEPPKIVKFNDHGLALDMWCISFYWKHFCASINGKKIWSKPELLRSSLLYLINLCLLPWRSLKKSHVRNRKTIKKEGQRSQRFLSWPQKGQIHPSVILLKTTEVHSSWTFPTVFIQQ